MLGSIINICVGLTMAMVPPRATGEKSVPALHPIEARVIEKTNSQRAQHGLPPLTVDSGLLTSARRHAAWMTNSRSMTHTNQPVGENIAMGQNSSSEVINSWMNSSGHRANILNPGYTRIGVAAYTTPEGTIYWCQQFLR
ncbi:MAG: CAP domain-containing protein [Planctomycetia bacterium]|nr:CAP domain-containing protein [Planctomycetia bacterium]